MRFTVALASLLASTATAAVAADGDVVVRSPLSVDANVDVKATVGADVDVDIKVDAAVKAAANFKCPSGMGYSCWTKACSCPPGMKFDLASKKCSGKEKTGAWPEIDLSVYASVGVGLGSFCAISPTHIVKYDAKHRYCQAGLDTIVFAAVASIAVEIDALAGAEIDLHANISADLKSTCAGLSGLYLDTAAKAVALFNTDVLGLATLEADVDAAISLNLGKTLNGVLCTVGLGKCHFDCVSYCTRGCKNYIDVGADVVVDIGVGIDAVVGLAILPNILLILGKTKVLVTVAVNGLLCLVGGLIKSLLSTFDCHCN
ncbi:Uncharacterized protein TPAR_03233 [Tolypocladium paradoxum]|uniref:Uncharacterized protein n=1 Tax=Tolypocladium paradoxum TaxID=94208 RepID=A0A2S4L2E9_9HYPO|nr:Uncharacterized protein TPAR_03233 [Tolypocladium paradoxum]